MRLELVIIRLNMALAPHSNFLANHETISCHVGSKLHSHKRFSCTRTDYFGSIVIVKICSRRQIHTYLQKSPRTRCGLDSRSLQLSSQGKQNLSSAHTINQNVPKENTICKFPEDVALMVWKKWGQLAKTAIVTIFILSVASKVDAVDALKTCTCLLKECRIELAKCIANPACAANVACLQTCNNRPDETECQIKCGDLFENSVVDEFNECAVSRKKCVPRKSDVGDFPVPDPSVLVQKFDMKDFNGKWFITSGLNPTFDAFDCQLHEFHTEGNKLVGNLTWRIRTPDGGFFTRSAVQKFVQDQKYPGILYNHDNEYLHYQDDWYILSSKVENSPDDYIFVYYKGRNDAWDGYGGSVLYTRSAVLPESIIPELQTAAQTVGRDFNTFIKTDNSCGPEPPLVERLEKKVEEGERTIIKEVEEIEEQVEKVKDKEVSLFSRLFEGFKELQQDEENFLRELSKEEMDILDGLKMEATQVEKLFGNALPLRKLR